MRYYEVYVPGRTRTQKRRDAKGELVETQQLDPIIATNVHDMRDLPEGTEVFRTITDRDGTLVETKKIPVVGGRVQIAGRGKRRPRIHYG